MSPQTSMLRSRRNRRRGFTLTEIMIVVLIIGLLAALALPTMLIARGNARGVRFINDLRQARAAFETYAIEQGHYPDDGSPGGIPAGMDEALRPVKWDEKTPIGGQWDWDYRQFGVVAGVSVFMPDVPDSVMTKIDERIDDGNLESGLFHRRANGYIFVIE